MHRLSPLIVIVLVAASAFALSDRRASRKPPGGHPKVHFNDNITPAGSLERGILKVRLEVRRGTWHLVGDDQPGGEVLAFAEQGKDPQIPGPMIRVPLGTEVRAKVRNPLDVPLVVHGLSARRVAVLDSLVVPPGEEREARFVADAEGTYYYRGTTSGAELFGEYEDALLSGALIVDPPGRVSSPNERVMVLGLWIGGRDEAGEPDFGREFLVINGRPWPYTERFHYELGDSVRWRLINATDRPHPMHLHGFFFRVDAKGDMARDTIYWPAQQRQAVTELMPPGSTVSLAWKAKRPGNWVFHCHLNWHVIANASLAPDRESSAAREQHLLRGHHDDPNHHVVHGMGGLMMGLYIQPPADWKPAEPKRRELRLFVESDSAPGDERPRFAYVLQEGDHDPAPGYIRDPGSPLILWKGQPTSVTVINNTPEATQVHWHGLEIESYYDGVAGVGGYPDRLTPAILPGDSFEMRITPPRAGSFMYHTHVNDIRQQTAGLYGAFIVLEPGEEWSPETDRVFLVSNGRSFDLEINGSTDPATIELRAGTRYRLRLMNITVQNPGLRMRLVRDGWPVRWRGIAKDGWDRPVYQISEVEADQPVSIGETYDMEYVPREPGELRLEVRSSRGRLLVDQPIEVRK